MSCEGFSQIYLGKHLWTLGKGRGLFAKGAFCSERCGGGIMVNEAAMILAHAPMPGELVNSLFASWERALSLAPLRVSPHSFVPAVLTPPARLRGACPVTGRPPRVRQRPVRECRVGLVPAVCVMCC